MLNQKILVEASLEDLASIIRKEVTETVTQIKASILPVEFLTKRDVAEYFQVTQRTVDNWIDSGWLKSYRIGNQVRFKRNEVENAPKLIAA